MKHAPLSLRQMLEAEHSKAQCNRIRDFIGEDPYKFAELIDALVSGPPQITQRAAWPLSEVAINHPQLVGPHLGRMISLLETPGLHNAVRRNILRLLPFVRIPPKRREKLIGLCFNFLATRNEPVAVHVCAMEVLCGLVQPYPELARELRIMLEEHMPYGSAGYRSRANKVLARLKGN